MRVKRWRQPHSEAPPACTEPNLLPLAAPDREFHVELAFAEIAPSANVGEYRRRVAKEQQAAAEADNRPFFLKYWYLFLPAVLFLLFGSAPDDAPADAPQGQAHAQSRKSKK